ncbi:MAG: dTMP kinase [Candidatus Pacebacteria bacterium]|nr:dTMP kinase [Candidatus Paceibacterota bacterium]
MRKGKFIVFEGGDGSGKNTQIELLKSKLPKNTVYVREPGGTLKGEEIRSFLMSEESKGMSPKAEIFLFYTARKYLLEEIIKPALEKGYLVVSNRFSPSTFAYQIYGRRRLDLISLFKKKEKGMVGDWKPDICLIFDVRPQIALQRIKGRTRQELTRFDKEVLEFHRRVRNGYLAAVNILRYNMVIIDASQSSEEIHKRVLEALKLEVLKNVPLL